MRRRRLRLQCGQFQNAHMWKAAAAVTRCGSCWYGTTRHMPSKYMYIVPGTAVDVTLADDLCVCPTINKLCSLASLGPRCQGGCGKCCTCVLDPGIIMRRLGIGGGDWAQE
jgi:hypothetical protein